MNPRALLSVIAIGLLCGKALAQEPAARPWSVEAEASVVSDYRFRGLSLSDNQPALQGGVTLSHASGAYGYVWGSTIDEYGADADGHGATVEVDLVLGWAGALAGLDWDISAQRYSYPRGVDVDYLEFPVTASKSVGDWRWTLGGAYAPSQRALGHQDNLYGWGGMAWGGDHAPLKLDLRAGYEDGAYAPGGKWDWQVGLTHGFGPLTAGLAYVDSDAASGRLVGSLTATF